MGLLACVECGNMVSSAAKACPKCGAPVPAAGDAAEATPHGAPAAARAPSPAQAPAKKSGMSKGCLAALGCTACLVIGILPVAGGAIWYGVQRPRAISPVALSRSTDDDSSRRYAPTRTIPTIAPEETPEERPLSTPKEAWSTATPRPIETPEPRPTVHSYAPAPRATQVVIAATPRPTPYVAPTPRPTPVAVATSRPVAKAAPTATALPWEDDGTGAAPITTPRVVAAATPAPTPKPVAVDPNARVIHAVRGDRTVSVNKNIAITGSDGKTVVGVLVNVANGFVDIRVSGQLLRIGEQDVLDAASY